MEVDLDRFCPTGIRALDEFLGGGIPRGSVILLIGKPGTGKASLALTFLYAGAKMYGEKGVFVSLLRPKESVYRMAEYFGMNFEELERTGLIEFIEFSPQLKSEFLETFLVALLNSFKNKGIKRIVIDSISPLIWFLGSSRARAAFYNSLYRVLREIGATTLITVNDEYGDPMLRELEYIVDGIINLNIRNIGGRTHRTLTITKMRGASAPPYEIPFSITHRGIVILLPPRPRKEQLLRREEVIRLGSPSLENVIGPIYRGSQILILTGYGVKPPTVLTAYMLNLVLLNNVRTLFVSFARPIDLQDLLHETSKVLVLTHDEIEQLNKLVKSLFIDASTYSVPEIIAMLWNYIEEVHAELVVLHGLRLLFELHKDENPYRYSYMDALALKAKGITTIRKMQLKPSEYTPVMEFSDIVLQIEGATSSDCVIRVLKTVRGRPWSEIACTLPFYEMVERRGRR